MSMSNFKCVIVVAASVTFIRFLLLLDLEGKGELLMPSGFDPFRALSFLLYLLTIVIFCRCASLLYVSSILLVSSVSSTVQVPCCC